MIKKLSLFYGEIYWVDFDPSLGHEFQGRRPAVVIQSDAQLKKSNLATVIPFTSNTRNMMKDDILVEPSSKNHLFQSSVLKVYDIYSFDQIRFVKKIGNLEPEVLHLIKKYLPIHFGFGGV